MCCITVCVLLCSVSLALPSLEGAKDPLLAGPSAPPPPLWSASLVMTHQAPVLALLTWPLYPVFVCGWERTLPPCLLA